MCEIWSETEELRKRTRIATTRETRIARDSRVDKNRAVHVFKIGDKVYVGDGSKLNLKEIAGIRLGSFKIVRKVSKSMYEVACGKRKKEAGIFHASKLLPV